MEAFKGTSNDLLVSKALPELLMSLTGYTDFIVVVITKLSMELNSLGFPRS